MAGGHISRTPPTVYTVPTGQPFADQLAAGLRSDALEKDVSLARYTVFLPNRRAIGALREAFLRLTAGKPTFLPQMRALGDVDEDALMFQAHGLGIEGADTVLPAISQDHRQLLLTRWLLDNGSLASHPSHAQAWRLARELALLMDGIETYQLDASRLADIVPPEMAAHWQVTLSLLLSALDMWPKKLSDLGLMNPVARRNKLSDLLIGHWQKAPPVDPIIAAGSTGSVPSTRNVMKAISRMAVGSIILPGFDRAISDRVWDVLDDTHPQMVMKTLLEHIGVDRREVRVWGSGQSCGPDVSARIQLAQNALMPAACTDMWLGIRSDEKQQREIKRGIGSLNTVIAQSRSEEAGAIAACMREALEVSGKTAALITPDRQLARYVREELKAWNILVDDTGGDKALNSMSGRLLALITRALSEQFSPVPMLALLKHPFILCGLSRAEHLAWVRRLDASVLRGTRPAAGLAGMLARGMHSVQEPKLDWAASDQKQLEHVIGVLEPLSSLSETKSPLDVLMDVHMQVAEGLCSNEETVGADILWKGEAGQVLADAIADLLRDGGVISGLDIDDYDALFDEMLTSVMVRPAWGLHPRLKILGPLEARLQLADLVILGGLNEGTWPMEPKPDTWMNGEMRAAFGLPSTAQRTGQSAHDFVQALGAKDVLLSRSEKVDGSPTVPSRWLLRMEALASAALPENSRYIKYAAQRTEHGEAIAPVSPPAPRPPVAARPKKLSVTQVQTWMRDPYALYADKVLGLKVWDEIDARPNAAHKGNMLHEALELFLKEDGPKEGEAGKARLLAIGQRLFSDLESQPTVYAFWWPRFKRLANWFVDNEAQRQAFFECVGVEVWANHLLPGTDFELIAKADRLDRDMESGQMVIIDYKTGTPPTARQLAAGFAPQLPLEGWLARMGAFEGIDAMEVAELVFWVIKGDESIQAAKSPHKSSRTHRRTAEELIDDAVDGLSRLVTVYGDEGTPYLAKPNPETAAKGYDDYDHLSRALEWGDMSEGGGE